jgi:geranylgeranyl pyrophosphate synthase
MNLVTQPSKPPKAFSSFEENSDDHSSLEQHLQAVEDCLGQRLNSFTNYPAELSARLVSAGGKRIRPLLLLATFESIRKALGIKDNSVTTLPQKLKSDDLHQLGAVAELVHTATLFHDDVIDESPERRGMQSAQILHGNKIAILVGDFVYAEAFARLMERAFLYPSQRLATTIQQLVEGEILQKDIVSSRNFKSEQIFQIAKLKTASLFSWCSETGAWATGQTDLIKAAFDFGHHLGVAFQLIDDVIDTLATPSKLDHDFCNEFVASAPSFPLMLLFEKEPQSFIIWKSLPTLNEETQAHNITSLIESCKASQIIEEARAKIEEILEEATTLATTLGNSEVLQELVNQLKIRANFALEGKAQS